MIRDGENIVLKRSVRTPNSEEYKVQVNDEEQGTLIIQFISENLEREYVRAYLILEEIWEDDSLDELITKIDFEIVDSIGAGSALRRQSFDIHVYAGDKIKSYHNPNTSEDEYETDQGVRDIRERVNETQMMVNDLPDLVNRIIEEQYEEVTDIIGSEASEETRQELQQSLRIGLERGLPTALFEKSFE